MGAGGSKKRETSVRGEEVNFDHFEVLRAIGKGSFGKVCIVQKKDTKKRYAMKYMNKHQCEAKEAVGNVFREIEILASLSHPFLVNLWFSFQDEEDMFMVVDLLLGGDLRYHVQRNVAFTDEAVRLYVLEVSCALEYLHRRKIIHRDIKPDNLLFDEEGHVHLTDFNIATVVRGGHHPSSMSGTKPYMAPEVFECAVDNCDGYSFPVDWWSLGVTAYEIKRGRRPFDIHSNTTLSEIRLMFLTPPKFPSEWSTGLVHLISKLLTISPASRCCSLESLQRIPFGGEVDINLVRRKQIAPPFTPPKEHLNCDPTFELEEMIIESKPLHKKKKRLSKQRSIRESQNSLSLTLEGESLIYEEMLIFNREKEFEKREKEKKEKEWQAELERSMSMSDPVGLGCTYSGSYSPTNCSPPFDLNSSTKETQESETDKFSEDTFDNNSSNSQICQGNNHPQVTSENERKIEIISAESIISSSTELSSSHLSEDENQSIGESSFTGGASLLAPSIPSLVGSSEPSPEPTSTQSSAPHSSLPSSEDSVVPSSSPSSTCPQPSSSQSHSPYGSPSGRFQRKGTLVAVDTRELQVVSENSEDSVIESIGGIGGNASPNKLHLRKASEGNKDNKRAGSCEGPYYSLSSSKKRPMSQPCFNLGEQLLREKFKVGRMPVTPHSVDNLSKSFIHSNNKKLHSDPNLKQIPSPDIREAKGPNRSISLEETLSEISTGFCRSKFENEEMKKGDLQISNSDSDQYDNGPDKCVSPNHEKITSL